MTELQKAVVVPTVQNGTKTFAEYESAIKASLTRCLARNCFWNPETNKVEFYFGNYEWLKNKEVYITYYFNGISLLRDGKFSEFENFCTSLHPTDETKMSFERIAVLDAVTEVLFDLNHENGKIKDQVWSLTNNPLFVQTHQSDVAWYKAFRKALHTESIDTIIEMVFSYSIPMSTKTYREYEYDEKHQKPALAVGADAVLNAIEEVGPGVTPVANSLLLATNKVEEGDTHHSGISFSHHTKRDKALLKTYKSCFCSWYWRHTKNIVGPVPLVTRDSLGNEYSKYFNKKYGTSFPSYFSVAHSKL